MVFQYSSSQISVCHLLAYAPSLHNTPIYVAGQDGTETFYSLHRHEVLTKPQYQRLIIGQIEGEESTIYDRKLGEASTVPYGEPTWLTKGYHSPYYTEVIHLQFKGRFNILTYNHCTGPQKIPASHACLLRRRCLRGRPSS